MEAIDREIMGDAEHQRPRDGSVIEVDGCRYLVGPYLEGNASRIYKLNNFGVGNVDGNDIIYWPHALYKVLIEATQ